MVEATQKTEKTQSKENDLVTLRSNYLAIAEMVASGNVSEPRLKELSQQIASNPLSENIKQAEAAKFPGPIQQVIHQTLQGTNGTTGSTKDSGVNQVMIAQSVAETKQAVIAETQRQQTIEPLSQEEEKLVDNFLDETDSRKRTEMLRTLPAPVLLKVQRGIFKRSERATQRLLETDYPSEQAEREACARYEQAQERYCERLSAMSDELIDRRKKNPDDSKTHECDKRFTDDLNNQNRENIAHLPTGDSLKDKTVRSAVTDRCIMTCCCTGERVETFATSEDKKQHNDASKNLALCFKQDPTQVRKLFTPDNASKFGYCYTAFQEACASDENVRAEAEKCILEIPLPTFAHKVVKDVLLGKKHAPEGKTATPSALEPSEKVTPSVPTTPTPTCCATLSRVGSKVPEKTDKDLNDKNLNDHSSVTR